ncbi:hypothetical protein EVAR_54763_1 [Eumeta japonica]|uniref:Uncharacterized protein n=1 Tax=Eumeta variegata TaxID=151549 RepID=A0A4C1YF30_EUMVA|nr:hypothetical protein EVAR_54763_1 [Eumeta japonica]
MDRGLMEESDMMDEGVGGVKGILDFRYNFEISHTLTHCSLLILRPVSIREKTLFDLTFGENLRVQGQRHGGCTNFPTKLY